MERTIRGHMKIPYLDMLGLSPTESDIYMFLLQTGETKAAQIIDHFQLKRATAYKALYALEEKGLVTKRDVGKITHFKPMSPNTLTDLADKQIHRYEAIRDDLKGILPNFISSYLLSVEKPVITTFEGAQGIKDVYRDTIKEGLPIDAILKVGNVDDDIQEWLESYYIKQRVKKKIPARVIIATDGETKEYRQKDKESLRETIVVPNKLFPFKHEINIYDGKVALINHTKGDDLLAIVIHHPTIEDTMRAWFQLAWVGAKSLK